MTFVNGNIICLNSSQHVVLCNSPTSCLCSVWPLIQREEKVFYRLVLLHYKSLFYIFNCIRFEGGVIEHCCRVSEGMAAAMEVRLTLIN